ncbi:putative glutathione S-transferase GSTU6 [Hordeum vulgare]|nr:putative glutathione S-transferase GSTU6 [Hordeum vulgare]
MDSYLKYIYEQYVESSDGSSAEEDYSDEMMMMMQTVLEDAEGVEEHVLNFKGSVKNHQVIKLNSVREHLTLMTDYFAPDELFVDHFRQCFRMHKTVFDRLYHGVWSNGDYFILKNDSCE